MAFESLVTFRTSVDPVWVCVFGQCAHSQQVSARSFPPSQVSFHAVKKCELDIRHWRHFLEGRPFHILTDQKPLTFALCSTTDRSPRQTTQLLFIAEFTNDILYVKGVENVVADTLSRVDAIALALDYAKLAADQAKSSKIQALRAAETDLILQDELIGEVSVLCDVSTGKRRPLIPFAWRKTVFDLIHGLSHAGLRPTARAVAQRFIWKNYKRDIHKWCQECQACQASKVTLHVKAPLQRRALPDRRFGSIHVDLVGPLPESRGMRYLLTVVDRFSRWMEAVPIPDITAETCVQALTLNWIARYGVPGDIVADRGAQFTSSTWKQLGELFGIKCSTTTAYHPQGNGLVERLHRQLKAAIMARENQANWVEHLPLALLGIRTAWRPDLGGSPAELTFGTALHLPGETVEPTTNSFSDHDFLQRLKTQMAELAPTQTSHNDTSRSEHVPSALDGATHVFVRRDARAPPLTRPYVGPFKVLEKHPKYFELDMNGKRDRVSIDRLKRAIIDDHCYDLESKNSDWSDQSRDREITEKKTSVQSERLPAQPLVKRGRLTREDAERKRENERDAERRRDEDRERNQREYGAEFPPLATRFRRPPDRL